MVQIPSNSSPLRRPVTFLLPDFLENWPYERRIHPDYGTIDVESTNWVLEQGLFKEKAQKAFDRCRFGLLGSLFYPLNDRDSARLGCDLTNALFVIDEYTDVADPDMATKVHDSIMDVLRNPDKEVKPNNKLEILMQDFWKRALDLTSGLEDPFVELFMEGFDLYLSCVVEESIGRETNLVHPVEKYLQIRRNTSAVQPSVALAGFGLDIPKEVVSHPALQRMIMTTIDLVCTNNDMHSYYDEFSRGHWAHNIISSIMKEHELDLPSAFEWLAAFGKQRMNTFLSGIEELPSWGEKIDEEVRKFVERLGYLIRGNDAWSYETERYWGKNGMEIMANRKVTIFLDAEDSKNGFCTHEELTTALET